MNHFQSTEARRMRGKWRKSAAAGAGASQRAGGFTIIELITAMVIFSLVVAAIFSAYMTITNGAVAANRAAAGALRSRVALQLLEEALGSARSFTADYQYYTFDAENGTEPYLSFVTRLSSSYPRSEEPDFQGFAVRRVTFSVEAAPDWGKRLVVRQNPMLKDLSDLEQNNPLVLANDVRKFEMEFFDKKKLEWVDEWTETNQLPQMIKFIVQFGGGPQSPPQEEFTRIVALPAVAVQPQWQAPGAIGLAPVGGLNSGGIGGGMRFGVPQH